MAGHPLAPNVAATDAPSSRRASPPSPAPDASGRSCAPGGGPWAWGRGAGKLSLRIMERMAEPGEGGSAGGTGLHSSPAISSDTPPATGAGTGAGAIPSMPKIWAPATAPVAGSPGWRGGAPEPAGPTPSSVCRLRLAAARLAALESTCAAPSGGPAMLADAAAAWTRSGRGGEAFAAGPAPIMAMIAAPFAAAAAGCGAGPAEDPIMARMAEPAAAAAEVSTAGGGESASSCSFKTRKVVATSCSVGEAQTSRDNHKQSKCQSG
jgi:hypothetical protein